MRSACPTTLFTIVEIPCIGQHIQLLKVLRLRSKKLLGLRLLYLKKWKVWHAIVLLFISFLAISLILLTLTGHSLAYLDSIHGANTVALFDESRPTSDADLPLNDRKIESRYGVPTGSLDQGCY